jgi:UDP:flavonoid glycosyltransferase YjiC (YdhE family)
VHQVEPSASRLVAFVLLPERTAFNASFVLARRLQQRGYRVAYIGPPSFDAHVSAQGFAYVALLPEPSLPMPRTGEPPRFVPEWWIRWRDSRDALRRYHEDLDRSLHRIEQWLRDNPAALVLLDPLMWEFSPPLLASKIPVVGLCSTLTAKLDIRFPPVFSDIVPDATPNGRAHFRYCVAWARLLVRVAGRRTVEALNLLSTVGPRRYRALNARSRVRRSGGALCYGEYGLRLAVPELVMSPRAIDFPQVAKQEGRVYVGGCVDPERRDRPFDWGAIEKGKPLIYCSLGTYSQFYLHGKRLFSAVIEAVKADQAWQAIIQVGDAAAPEEFGPLPPRILLTRFAPQLSILEHATVFMTHGGFGSVREGAFFGVPMIVFPCWLDQFGNAMRVMHYGIGVRADIATVDAERIRALLQRVRDPQVRDSVERMQAAFRQHASCQDGVDWIERFLSTAKATD